MNTNTISLLILTVLLGGFLYLMMARSCHSSVERKRAVVFAAVFLAVALTAQFFGA